MDNKFDVMKKVDKFENQEDLSLFPTTSPSYENDTQTKIKTLFDTFKKTFDRARAPFLRVEDKNSIFDKSPTSLFLVKTSGAAFIITMFLNVTRHKAYFKERFLDRNQVTLYDCNIRAKRRMVDNMLFDTIVYSLSDALKKAMFVASTLMFTFAIKGARQKNDVWNYGLGCGLTGAIFKLNMGLRGMIVAGGLGVTIGLFAGTIIQSLLKLNGLTIDEFMEMRRSDLVKSYEKKKM